MKVLILRFLSRPLIGEQRYLRYMQLNTRLPSLFIYKFYKTLVIISFKSPKMNK